MGNRVGAVLLFDVDGYVSAFPSVEEAAAWMEPNDVLDGEYAAVFTLDGHVVTPTTTDAHRVTLTVTEERDATALRHRLKVTASRYGLASPSDDVLAVANELLRREWQSRWPTRPRWLSRRLYGDGPTQLQGGGRKAWHGRTTHRDLTRLCPSVSCRPCLSPGL